MSIALEQFLDDVPAFDDLFHLPAACDRERMLRSEMRRTMTALSSALRTAAANERSTAMAHLYSEAAQKAATFATKVCRRSSH